MARKFLYFIAACIVLIIAGGIAWQFFGPALLRFASVPGEKFVAPPPAMPNAYADAKMWLSRPGKTDDPSRWLPTGVKAPESRGKAAIFYVHPTSFLFGKGWNARLDDTETNTRTRIFVRGQASVFSAAGDIWAPYYRQASFGAFMTDEPDARRAIDAAYADVALAFDQFLKDAGDRPIILAGHSQGSLHMTRLLKEKIAGSSNSERIVAAYVIGWPISIEADLGALGLPACREAAQRGCLISYQSFAEPADYADVVDLFEALPGLANRDRKGTHILCSNPLTGGVGGVADAAQNPGMIKNEPDFSGGALEAKRVGARCDEKGILLIGAPPALGPYVLPGNNYHVYDYSLFWASLRADALRRLAAWG